MNQVSRESLVGSGGRGENFRSSRRGVRKVQSVRDQFREGEGEEMIGWDRVIEMGM